MRKQRNQALAVCAYVYVVFHNDGMQARMHAERKKTHKLIAQMNRNPI